MNSIYNAIHLLCVGNEVTVISDLKNIAKLMDVNNISNKLKIKKMLRCNLNRTVYYRIPMQ